MLAITFKKVSVAVACLERKKRMKSVLENGLQALGLNAAIQSFHSVSGGSINEAFCVKTEQQTFFVKLNREVTAAFFEFEQRGMEEIRATDTISVPDVFGVVTDPASGIPMLWLEWTEGEKRPDTEVLLGERLAVMHRETRDQFGLEGNSYIGRLDQENALEDSWLVYYRDYRLKGQLEMGRERGRIQGERAYKLVRLLDRLDEWIPEKPAASLLHGDLWGGNWMTGSGGVPYLIDPSILYGDHEFEIAFTHLFGGFSESFYDAYRSVFPLSGSYQEREPLYQLYYLLVHLNLFGETYGGAVDRILRRYVG